MGSNQVVLADPDEEAKEVAELDAHRVVVRELKEQCPACGVAGEILVQHVRVGLIFQVDALGDVGGVDPHVRVERVGMPEKTVQRVVVGRAKRSM